MLARLLLLAAVCLIAGVLLGALVGLLLRALDARRAQRALGSEQTQCARCRRPVGRCQCPAEARERYGRGLWWWLTRGRAELSRAAAEDVSAPGAGDASQDDDLAEQGRLPGGL